MFQKKDIYILTITNILKDWNELLWLTSYQRKRRGKVTKFWLLGKIFWQKIFAVNFFPVSFHSLKRLIFYLLCFHTLRYKNEAALSAYPWNKLSRVRLVANAIEVTFDYHLLSRPYAVLEHTCFHCLVLLAKYI